MTGADEPARAAPPGDDRTQLLARAARGGDEASFAALYEHLAPALLTWAELRLRPGQRLVLDPADLVQEVFARAWRGLEGVDLEAIPIRAWLFRVAKNVALEVARAARRQGSAGGPGPSTRQFALANLPDSVTAVSQRLQREERLRSFHDAIEALPEEDRDLVLHCGLEGLPYKEVAERMGLGLEAVSKRWQRLRKRMLEGGLPGTLLALDGVG